MKETSFRALVTRRKLDNNLILGNQSLGALFEEAGYPAVPSPTRSPGFFNLILRYLKIFSHNPITNVTSFINVERKFLFL